MRNWWMFSIKLFNIAEIHWVKLLICMQRNLIEHVVDEFIGQNVCQLHRQRLKFNRFIESIFVRIIVGEFPKYHRVIRDTFMILFAHYPQVHMIIVNSINYNNSEIPPTIANNVNLAAKFMISTVKYFYSHCLFYRKWDLIGFDCWKDILNYFISPTSNVLTGRGHVIELNRKKPISIIDYHIPRKNILIAISISNLGLHFAFTSRFSLHRESH